MDSVAVPREREETDVRSAAPVLEARVGVDADAATSSSSSTIVIGTRRHVGFGAEDPGSGVTGTSRGVYSVGIAHLGEAAFRSHDPSHGPEGPKQPFGRARANRLGECS
jgi:hypothetical protein